MKPKDPVTTRAESLVEMVRQLARRLAIRKRMAVDELIGVGNEAALRAAREFDESRGVPFNAFAFNKIRWAMLDAARAERAARGSPYVDRTPPGAVDLEMALQDTPETVRARARAWVEQNAASGAAGAALWTVEPRTPEDDAIQERGLATIRSSIDELPEKERLFAKRFYTDGRTELEIAAELGVSRRTAQRIHESMKARLAGRLRRTGAISTASLLLDE